MGEPWRIEAEGLSLSLRLTPRGGRDAIEGTETLANGRRVVKARVRAAPEDGAANEAACALVARVFGVAKREAELTQGHKSRLKTILVRGKVDDLMVKARALLPLLALMWAVFSVAPALAQQELDQMIRALSCVEKRSYYETGVALMRGQDKTQINQQLRTYRMALELALEGCKGPDVFLLKRSVGMVNALNRQLGLPPMSPPSAIKE